MDASDDIAIQKHRLRAALFSVPSNSLTSQTSEEAGAKRIDKAARLSSNCVQLAAFLNAVDSLNIGSR